MNLQIDTDKWYEKCQFVVFVDQGQIIACLNIVLLFKLYLIIILLFIYLLLCISTCHLKACLRVSQIKLNNVLLGFLHPEGNQKVGQETDINVGKNERFKISVYSMNLRAQTGQFIQSYKKQVRMMQCLFHVVIL